MPLKNLDEITNLVRKHFGFLFERGVRVIFSDYHANSNFAIVLETTDLRIRFFRERGTIYVHAGPSWATADWSGEPWYDLIVVIAFITQKQVLISEYWKDRFNDDKELERLAEVLLFYYDQIVELFRTDTFLKQKGALDLMKDDIISLHYEPGRRTELQKLLEQSNKFWQQVNPS